MEEIKLSNDVFDQTKDFVYWELTEEQEVLIDKLILNKELKGRYKEYGLCDSLSPIIAGVSHVVPNISTKFPKLD